MPSYSGIFLLFAPIGTTKIKCLQFWLLAIFLVLHQSHIQNTPSTMLPERLAFVANLCYPIGYTSYEILQIFFWP